MNYKKLSAVLKAQGKDYLAQKLYKEKVISKKELYTFEKLNIGSFKSGSVIKIITDKYIPVFSFYAGLHTIAYQIENKKADLILHYDKFFANYFMFESEGIKVHNQWLGYKLISKSCEPIDLDLEMRKNPNLKLAIISGEDCYQGRYDKSFTIKSSERPELFTEPKLWKIDE